jgi:hypothetical protein
MEVGNGCSCFAFIAAVIGIGLGEPFLVVVREAVTAVSRSLMVVGGRLADL